MNERPAPHEAWVPFWLALSLVGLAYLSYDNIPILFVILFLL